MLIRIHLVACFFLVGAFVATDAQQLRAQQDCGDGCIPCALIFFEGIEHNEFGPWDMQCQSRGGGNNFLGALGENCAQCEGPGSLALVGDHAVDTAEIVEMIESTSADDLGAIGADYGDRLLLNPSRNMLVVQGSSCNPETLQSVLFLPTDKVDVLQGLGVRSLESFLKVKARPSS